MADPYYVNLEQFSLEWLKGLLETGEVLPGRRILKEKIPERFGILESMGIRNLQELLETIKTKKRIASFAQKSGLPEEYLVILRRDVNAYRPNPVNLEKIPGLDPEQVEKLAALGIKHSKHLFIRVKTKGERVELAKQAGVPEEDLLEMVKLSDLVRISGVGPVFARIIYQAGYDTLEKMANATPEEMHERLWAVNREGGYTKIMATLKETRYCIEYAQQLPKVIEY